MANPLILPTGRQDLMKQVGRELRQANRQKEDELILRKAMTIFRQHLPQISYRSTQYFTNANFFNFLFNGK